MLDQIEEDHERGIEEYRNRNDVTGEIDSEWRALRPECPKHDVRDFLGASGLEQNLSEDDSEEDDDADPRQRTAESFGNDVRDILQRHQRE